MAKTDWSKASFLSANESGYNIGPPPASYLVITSCLVHEPGTIDPEGMGELLDEDLLLIQHSAQVGCHLLVLDVLGAVPGRPEGLRQPSSSVPRVREGHLVYIIAGGHMAGQSPMATKQGHAMTDAACIAFTAIALGLAILQY